MSKADIQRLLKPRVRDLSAKFRLAGIWTYMLFPAVALVLGGINLAAYGSQGTALLVVSAMTLAAAGILGYGVFLAREHVRMQRADDDVTAALRRHLRFYRTRYHAWLWLSAGALVLLTLNVQLLSGPAAGPFPLEPAPDFIAVTLVQFFAAYGIFRLGQYAFHREMQAILSDLERQVTEATEQFDASFKPVWTRWIVGAVVVGTILLLLILLAVL